MKPETATIVTVGLLLAGSAWCVGARVATDRERANQQGRESKGEAALRAPEETRKTVKTERPAPLPSDPDALAARLRAMLRTSNQSDSTRALLELVPTLKDGDWPLVLEALDKIGMVWGSNGHALIIYAWTERDPQAAMAWAKSRNGGESYVMRAWIGKDPDAALAYLKSVAGDRSTPNVLMLAGAVGAFGKDLPRIRELLMAVPERSSRMLVQQAHPQLTGIPADTLYAWADGFEGPRRESVMELLLTNLEGVDAKLSLARRFPDDIGPEKYGSIYREWFNADEAAAFKALEELEPGPLHKSAVFGVTCALYQKRRLPEAIALTKRWPEEISQVFLSDLLLIDEMKHAELILAEIPRLQNDELKVNRYHCVLDPWFKENPEKARKWLAENEVPEQVRKEFEGR